jgi:hypothetical protein
MTCPHCGQSFECPKRYRGDQISCPACKHLVPFPRRSRIKLLVALLVPLVLIILAAVWLVWPMGVRWPDRRPIGVLFLASNAHSSAKNPRGWFNDDNLDVIGPGGQERFRKALMDYEDASIAVLKRIGAQGVIVWDVEGEEYPHKTTYIGDPRLVNALAPEMAPLADDFFKRLRDAGFSVGVTIRPQQLVFYHGLPRQVSVLDIKGTLAAKIDYARTRWGATLFYIDSTYSFLRPDEVWQLRLLAAEHPDVLLIPEHHYLPYTAFSAPYVPLRRNPDASSAWARKLFPNSFETLDVADISPDQLATDWHHGDILLFRAWYWNDDCDLLERFKGGQK